MRFFIITNKFESSLDGPRSTTATGGARINQPSSERMRDVRSSIYAASFRALARRRLPANPFPFLFSAQSLFFPPFERSESLGDRWD